MKHKSLVLAVTTLFLASTIDIPEGHASTFIENKVFITMDNGKSMSKPMSIRANDPWARNVTTYVPIWYVMNALKTVKSIQSTWDGSNWRMTLPSDVPVNSALTPHPGSGSLRMYVNGKLVQTAIPIRHVDPSSNVLTTYVPIYYVTQALKYANITSTWDGASWDIRSWLTKGDGINQIAQMSTQMGVLSGVAYGLPLPLDDSDSNPNPYDDVPSNDWSTVDAAISNRVMQPDSPTHVGLNDPLSKSEFGQMYWNWLFYSFNNLTPPSHTRYQPGGNPQDWARIIGLYEGLSNGPVLLYTDNNTLWQNLANYTQGFSIDHNSRYHVYYPPTDEYRMFGIPNGLVPIGTGVGMPPNDQAAVTQTYKEFNAISWIRIDKDNSEFSLPTFPIGSPWHVEVTRLLSDTQWSHDGGKTWITAGKAEPQPPGQSIWHYYYGSWDSHRGGLSQVSGNLLIKAQCITVLFSEVVNGKTFYLGQVTVFPHANQAIDREIDPFIDPYAPGPFIDPSTIQTQ